MRRLTGLALITCLSVTASGCGLVDNVLGRFTGGGDENLEEDSTVILLDEEPEAETFEEPLLPGLPSAAEIASAELISSTSPSARLQQIERARQDPFALVAVPPPPTVAPPPAGAGGGGGGGGGGATPVTNGGGTTPGPNGGGSPIVPLPALPQPTTAQGVVVTGIVQINGERYAIVDAPGEPTSRYVRPGDRLSNGRILVKRIDTRPGSEPVLVLEENGIEVARPVGGSAPGNSPVEEAPAADLPSLPPAIATAG
jgi:hypothetical protein